MRVILGRIKSKYKEVLIVNEGAEGSSKRKRGECIKLESVNL